MREVRLIVIAALVLAACESAGTGTSAIGPPALTAAIPGSTTTAITALAPVAQSTSSTTLPQPSTSLGTTAVPSTAPATTTTTVVDGIAPELTVTDPAAEAVVTDRAYRFRGATEPGATVTAAGRYPVNVESDGSWSIVLMLNSGGNVATFVAEDAAGNRTAVRHAVYLHECADEPAVAIPAGATEVTSTSGDLDGDGEPDKALVYRSTGSWFLGVELDYGWSSAIDITAQTEPWFDPASVYRIVDVGDPVILVIHGGTLIGFTSGPYGFDECALAPLRDLDRGEILQLFSGVSIGNPQRFVCQPDGFTQAGLARIESGDGFIIDRVDARYLSDRRGFEVWAHPPEVIGEGLAPAELDLLWSETLAQYPQC